MLLVDEQEFEEMIKAGTSSITAGGNNRRRVGERRGSEDTGIKGLVDVQR